MSGGITTRRPTVGFAREVITVAGTAVGLTTATYRPTGAKIAQVAFITAEQGNMRYTYDGTTATSTIGHILSDGCQLELLGEQQMSLFSIIRTGSVSGSLQITYERE